MLFFNEMCIEQNRDCQYIFLEIDDGKSRDDPFITGISFTVWLGFYSYCYKKKTLVHFKFPKSSSFTGYINKNKVIKCSLPVLHLRCYHPPHPSHWTACYLPDTFLTEYVPYNSNNYYNILNGVIDRGYSNVSDEYGFYFTSEVKYTYQWRI